MGWDADREALRAPSESGVGVTAFTAAFLLSFTVVSVATVKTLNWLVRRKLRRQPRAYNWLLAREKGFI